MTDDRKAAYLRLAAAIEDVARIEEAPGLFAEWVVLYATVEYDEEGDSPSFVGRLTPEGAGAPYHRIMGLVDYAHTQLRAEVADASRA